MLTQGISFLDMKAMTNLPRTALGVAAATVGLAAIAVTTTWIIPSLHEPPAARTPPSVTNQDTMKLHPELMRILDNFSIDHQDFDLIVETFTCQIEKPEAGNLERIRSIVSSARIDECAFISLASVLGGSPLDARLASCLLRAVFCNNVNAQTLGPMAVDFISRICDQFFHSPTICGNLLHIILLSIDSCDSVMQLLVENNFLPSLVDLAQIEAAAPHAVAAQRLVHAAYQSGLYPARPGSPPSSPCLQNGLEADASALASSSHDSPRLLDSKAASNPASPPLKSGLELGHELYDAEAAGAASALEPLVYELLQSDSEGLDVTS